MQRNNLSTPKYFLRTIRTYLLVAGSPWEFLRMWMKQLFLYLHEMYKCSWVLGSLFFSPWLYLMCVSSRLRAQRDKCTVHPHHNSTMFNYSPSKDTGQLSFKLVLYLWMIENQPSQYSVSGSDQGTCSYKLGEWGVGDQDHIPVCTMAATRLLISYWKATANYIYLLCRINACACSHFLKLSPPAAVYNRWWMMDFQF